MFTTVSTPTIECILGLDEMRTFIDSTNVANLALISVTDPGSEPLPLSYCTKFKAYLQVQFWDVEEPINQYTPIDQTTAHTIQQFILANLDSPFAINCMAGRSRSAGIGKAIECIKFFGIGDTAKFNYQTSFNSEIDAHSRYYPNLTVFDSIVKVYDAH